MELRLKADSIEALSKLIADLLSLPEFKSNVLSLGFFVELKEPPIYQDLVITEAITRDISAKFF